MNFTAADGSVYDAVNRPFVIIFSGRSGSTFLTSLLDSHPNVRCALEVFATKGKGGTTRIDEVGTPELSLARLKQLYTRKNLHAVGFKIKPHQFEMFPEISESLLRNRQSVLAIELIRESFLQVAVSRQINEQLAANGLKRHRSRQHEIPPDFFPIKLNAPEVVRNAKGHRARTKTIGSLVSQFAHRIQVSYEQLCTQQAETQRRILEFLEVDSNHPLQSDYLKIVSTDYRSCIENYDEVISAIHDGGLGKHISQLL